MDRGRLAHYRIISACGWWLAALGIDAILTTIGTERGLHDWLLGTRVVRR